MKFWTKVKRWFRPKQKRKPRTVQVEFRPPVEAPSRRGAYRYTIQSSTYCRVLLALADGDVWTSARLQEAVGGTTARIIVGQLRTDGCVTAALETPGKRTISWRLTDAGYALAAQAKQVLESEHAR